MSRSEPAPRRLTAVLQPARPAVAVVAPRPWAAGSTAPHRVAAVAEAAAALAGTAGAHGARTAGAAPAGAAAPSAADPGRPAGRPTGPGAIGGDDRSVPSRTGGRRSRAVPVPGGAGTDAAQRADGAEWARDPAREPDPGPGRDEGCDAEADGSRPAAGLHPGPGGLSGPRTARAAARWLPASWRSARADPGRPGAIALVVVAVVAAAAAGFGVWMQRPRSEPVAPLPAVSVTTVTADGPDAAASADAPPAVLVVSVVGKVAAPGLVELADGARVADALEAAGGALPGVDLATLNLARRLTDGEQVAVGVPAAPDAGGVPVAGTPGGAAPGPGPLDLNTATLAQLDGLPGIGPVTAQRILDWRSAHGRFSRVEQLREIEGIGERRFAQLRELVRT